MIENSLRKFVDAYANLGPKGVLLNYVPGTKRGTPDPGPFVSVQLGTLIARATPMRLVSYDDGGSPNVILRQYMEGVAYIDFVRWDPVYEAAVEFGIWTGSDAGLVAASELGFTVLAPPSVRDLSLMVSDDFERRAQCELRFAMLWQTGPTALDVIEKVEIFDGNNLLGTVDLI